MHDIWSTRAGNQIAWEWYRAVRFKVWSKKYDRLVSDGMDGKFWVSQHKAGNSYFVDGIFRFNPIGPDGKEGCGLDGDQILRYDGCMDLMTKTKQPPLPEPVPSPEPTQLPNDKPVTTLDIVASAKSFAESIRNGSKLPPVVLMPDGKPFGLTHGGRRLVALDRTRIKMMLHDIGLVVPIEKPTGEWWSIVLRDLVDNAPQVAMEGQFPIKGLSVMGTDTEGNTIYQFGR